MKVFFVCLWVKGQSQGYCHNRLQAGEPQKAEELALGGQRSTGEGRQVDRARGLLLVSSRYLLANSVKYRRYYMAARRYICYLPAGYTLFTEACGLWSYSRPRAQFFPIRTDLGR